MECSLHVKRLCQAVCDNRHTVAVGLCVCCNKDTPSQPAWPARRVRAGKQHRLLACVWQQTHGSAESARPVRWALADHKTATFLARVQRVAFESFRHLVKLSPALSNQPNSVQRVAFESFRDLVKLSRKGLTDAQGLAYVADEALDLRVAARTKASAAAGVPVSSVAPAPQQTLDFSGEAPPAEAELLEDSGDDAAEDDMINAVEEDAGTLDGVAQQFGIATFSAQLQRAIVQVRAPARSLDPSLLVHLALHCWFTCSAQLQRAIVPVRAPAGALDPSLFIHLALHCWCTEPHIASLLQTVLR